MLNNINMPTRRDVFVNGGVYHIFSKSIDKKLIFIDNNMCFEFIESVKYYKDKSNNLRFSKHKQNQESNITNEVIIKRKPRVEILAYCLMPNHYHLLIKQKKDKGIIKFMADILNSFTRYYNSKNKRKGSVFLTPFRSRKIVSDEQFIHTSRYIHLNPYSAGIVNSYESLLNYQLSSLREYIKEKNNGICNTEPILKLFGNNRKRYKEFVIENANYQQTLEYVKYAKVWL